MMRLVDYKNLKDFAMEIKIVQLKNVATEQLKRPM